MARPKSERYKEIITGIICPQCGRDKSSKVGEGRGGELRCRFCGHKWVSEVK